MDFHVQAALRTRSESSQHWHHELRVTAVSDRLYEIPAEGLLEAKRRRGPEEAEKVQVRGRGGYKPVRLSPV
jgi:hypothetical protein